MYIKKFLPGELVAEVCNEPRKLLMSTSLETGRVREGVFAASWKSCEAKAVEGLNEGLVKREL